MKCKACKTFSIPTNTGICPSCKGKVFRVVRTNKHRTHDTSGIRPSEFLAAVIFFNHKCAYCQESPWELLEHITPVSKGGCTMSYNVLPSCVACNNRKKMGVLEMFVKYNYDRANIQRINDWIWHHDAKNPPEDIKNAHQAAKNSPLIYGT